MQHATDILVIGLGPAGACAAASAARGGARVIALDRRREAGVPVQCAELVPALLTQDCRLPVAVLRQSIGRMLSRIENEAADERAPFPGYMLDRAAFDRVQVEDAAAAGADCRFGIAVSAVDGSGVVTAADGTRYTADVVIGADGPSSRCGRAIGQVNRELVYARQVTVPLHTPHDATDIFLSNDYPGGYGWLFPRGEVAHLGIGVERAARGALKVLLARLHGDLHRCGRVGAEVMRETGGAIPVGGARRPWAARGTRLVLLAGDAAGLTNPVTGAGIHAAVASGQQAGAAAVTWLAGDTAAGPDYAAELDDQFGATLRRAGQRRATLMAAYRARGKVTTAELRNGWIAYADYWAPLGAPQSLAGDLT